MRTNLRHLSLGLISLMLAFSVACSKKVKEDKDAKGEGAGEEKAAISQESLSFNPSGSDSGTIEGLSTVHFKLDSSVIDTDARKTLTTNAAWAKAHKTLTIQIEGHCDNRGSVEYNLALGERRAKAVRDYLVSLGVDAKHLTIISYGKEKPIEAGDTEAAYAKNRRANFVPLAN
jgi:peptidoglycan-associated lipoprotein